MRIRDYLHYWLDVRPAIHRFAVPIALDPEDRGLLVGMHHERIPREYVPWEKIKELRRVRHVFKDEIAESGWYGNYIMVLMNGKECITREIPDLWEERICKKAGLKKHRRDFWYGQDIFSRE